MIINLLISFFFCLSAQAADTWDVENYPTPEPGSKTVTTHTTDSSGSVTHETYRSDSYGMPTGSAISSVTEEPGGGRGLSFPGPSDEGGDRGGYDGTNASAAGIIGWAGLLGSSPSVPELGFGDEIDGRFSYRGHHQYDAYTMGGDYMFYNPVRREHSTRDVLISDNVDQVYSVLREHTNITGADVAAYDTRAAAYESGRTSNPSFTAKDRVIRALTDGFPGISSEVNYSDIVDIQMTRSAHPESVAIAGNSALPEVVRNAARIGVIGTETTPLIVVKGNGAWAFSAPVLITNDSSGLQTNMTVEIASERTAQFGSVVVHEGFHHGMRAVEAGAAHVLAGHSREVSTTTARRASESVEALQTLIPQQVTEMYANNGMDASKEYVLTDEEFVNYGSLGVYVDHAISTGMIDALHGRYDAVAANFAHQLQNGGNLSQQDMDYLMEEVVDFIESDPELAEHVENVLDYLREAGH